METKTELDRLFSDAKLWRREASDLRRILLQCDLTETLKWRQPCYTHDGKNICIIQRMKGHLSLLFFKGALLEDPDGVLEVQGPNSRAGYRMRFASVQDVARLAKHVKACVREAIEVEKAGFEIDEPGELELPSELIEKFARDPALKDAFEALTPGRRRGYAMFFASAKQSKTRVARIEKHYDDILNGKGLHDRG